MGRAAVVVVAFWVVCGGRVAAAPVDDVPAAREHFAKGKRLYDLGRFSDAAAEYEAAYQAKDDPALLYNLGQAYRLSGNHGKALLAYKAYLRNVPDADNRAEVEERIRELQPAADTPPVAPPVGAAVVSAPAAPPPHVDTGWSKRVAGVTVGAAGLAVVGAGIVFAVLSKQAGDAAYRPPSGVYDFNADERQSRYRAADIACFTIGGAAVLAGTVLWTVGHREGTR